MKKYQKELKKYNEKLTKDLEKIQIVSDKDLKLLDRNMSVIKHSMRYAQIFRTDTEARVSILNDSRHPTPDSKYWQSIREMKVHADQLFYLNFDYKEKIIDLDELMSKLKKNKYNNKFDKLRDENKLERINYELIQMSLTAKDRIREIDMWSTIIKELKPNMEYSNQDVNEHQLFSYLQKFSKLLVHATDEERKDLGGLLYTTLKTIEERGLKNKFLKGLDKKTLSFLEQNKLLK